MRSFRLWLAQFIVPLTHHVVRKYKPRKEKDPNVREEEESQEEGPSQEEGAKEEG